MLVNNIIIFRTDPSHTHTNPATAPESEESEESENNSRSPCKQSIQDSICSTSFMVFISLQSINGILNFVRQRNCARQLALNIFMVFLNLTENPHSFTEKYIFFLFFYGE